MGLEKKYQDKENLSHSWKGKVHEIIYEADTRAGKLFDIVLLLAILLSVLGVMLESVDSLNTRYEKLFLISEWVFTVLFTAEYILRIISVGKPWKYIFSFFGLVDLLSLLPTYFGLFLSGPEVLRVIRLIRLVRIFRILKLVRYVGASRLIMDSLRASRAKIVVFLLAVLIIAVLMGSLMYIVEDGKNGFTSIPRSIYWAVVTLTTVGYGDISPATPLGQSIAMLIMIMGYGIIAVPTGIVTAEITANTVKSKGLTTVACRECSKDGHAPDAEFCKYCGEKLGSHI